MAAQQPTSALPEAPEAKPCGTPKRIERRIQGRMLAGIAEPFPFCWARKAETDSKIRKGFRSVECAPCSRP